MNITTVLFRVVRLFQRISYPFILVILSFFTDVAVGTEDFHTDNVTVSSQLNLRDVLEKTFERNPKQHVLQALDHEVQARYIYARSVLPSAPAVNVRHQNDAIQSGRGEREWEAEIELPVWLPGQRNARETLAKSTQTSLAASHKGLMLQLAGVLRDAIWDLNMNKEAAALYDSRIIAAQKLEYDIERRYEAGELAKTDLMLAQGETLSAKTSQLKAFSELQHAKYRYISLTGLHEIPAHLNEDLSMLVELPEKHPLIFELSSQAEIATKKRELLTLESRENPQFMLSARSVRGGFDNQYNDSIGIKVRIPFSSGASRAPTLALAESNIAKTMAEKERLELVMKGIFHEAEHNLGVTKKELDFVKTQNKLVQENLRLAHKAFTLGETDLVSLLRVQALAFEAEKAVASRKIQLQWDIARYNQAVGVLP